MTITEYEPNQFEQLEGIWRNLENGRDMTIFQSFDWYSWINSMYEKEKVKNVFRRWIYFLCEEAGKRIIVPLQLVPHGLYFHGIGIENGAYFIGRIAYADYLNVIYTEFDGKMVSELLKYVSDKYKIRKFHFERVLDTTEFFSYVNEKYNIVINKVMSAASLVLPDSFELYNAGLKKSFKQNMRTAMNRQKKDFMNFSHELIYMITPELQQELMSVRQQRLKEKDRAAIKKLSSKIYNFAYRNIATSFNARVNLFDCFNKQWCFVVKKEDKVVGFFYGIWDEHIYYVILAGVDKEYAWYSPSISHLYMQIKELYENENNSIKIIDFTRGDERYKTDIGGVVKAVYDFTIEL